MSSYFESLITTGSSALNDQEWQFSKEIGEVKTISLSFFFFFLLSNICTDCARATVTKAVDTLAWIKAVAPNYTGSH